MKFTPFDVVIGYHRIKRIQITLKSSAFPGIYLDERIRKTRGIMVMVNMNIIQ